jgi:hypothetical protein
MEPVLQPARLATSAYEEFNGLGDYIWKVPRFVDSERESELAKLEQYFPDKSRLRDLRWQAESHNLDHVFSYLIATGNLYALLSLFESYLLALCVGLQSGTTVQLNNIPGNGVNRLFHFLEKLGVPTKDSPLYPQVQAAIRIRNCLIHASGVLSLSNANRYLREIQLTGVYLATEHQHLRTDENRKYVCLQASPLGDRIMIGNDYCFLLCFYLRDYFVALCERAEGVTEPFSSAPLRNPEEQAVLTIAVFAP